ncbi:MAG: prolyl oligopeptidase family serine peptidase [Clostridium sp.]|nr:prolyl oligopeptidase family serine peptidase [Clostridium sp.]
MNNPNILLSSATLILGGAALIASSCSSKKIEYPKAPSDDTVDEYFGTSVPDPYRPLENDTSAETARWVEEENAVTRAYLDRIPFRGQIHDRLTSLNNYVKSRTPWKGRDGKYYYSENNGLQNQFVVFRTDSLGGEAEVFLDPNTLSEDGTVALTGLFPSNNGKYVAYTISRSGSDWTEIYLLDAKTKELLPDHIEWAKFTGASWYGDGFFYSAYPRPKAGKEFSNANENHQIYYHKIGTPQSDDILVFEDKANPLHFHSAEVPESEDYLFITVGGQGVGNGLMVRDLRKGFDSPLTVIEPSQDYEISVIDVRDGKIFMATSADAPNKQIVVADAARPQRANWKTLVAEAPEVLASAQFAGNDHLLLGYEKDASSHLYLHNLDGSRLREVELPGYGSVSAWSDRSTDEVFYNFSGFTTPGAIYAYNLADGTSTLVREARIDGFNPDDYVTEQVFYPSSDGTKIPMFLTYKKGLQRDGSNPVFLYGYGGFNISLPPSFSANRLLWLENGGIYAQANLRGGSEYGEKWHEAGTKMNKMNVFNDFIAAAEYLVDENWTSPEHIAINGGSNGGLLVGAVTNLRPDLFAVAVPQVGVMDMMRYHLFTIGWNWASDYGTSADSKEMADYLLSYSPVHTIRNDGTPYPAILVTTADHDDRVVPAHSFKYAATLQAADTGDKPKLIRIDSKAGHGAGKPMSKVIDEQTDIYSFIFENLGMTPEKY